MGKRHPIVGDTATFRFAGKVRTGKVCEVEGVGKDKTYVIICNGVYYPCLTLNTAKLNHIISYIVE